MCYRLIWNLKNTGKIDSFEKVISIEFSSVDSKLYGLISCEGNKKFVFDLSKVYTDIPSTLNGKKFDVTPEGHEINVTVNESSDKIRTYLSNPNKEDDKTSQNIPSEEEEEVTADTVEEKVLGNDEIHEEEKQEILEKFEENIVEKLEENGLKIEDEEETE